ncbi:MAG: sigma 54-interacting transcriptional regulator [Planctomycetaceae bacterium]
MALEQGLPPFVARSAAMRAVVQQIALVKDSAVPVLLSGESGSGREVAALLIHRSGARRAEPFVQLDCATLEAAPLDEVLFGDREPGRLEMAASGTIFLRSVDRLSLDAQARLLGVLERGVVERMGGRRICPVRARILASCDRDLRELAKEGGFRSDLYNRLNLFRIAIPPLRERREDIVPLAQMILENNRARHAADGHVMDEQSLAAIQAYAWPGNVRELEEVVLGAILASGGDGTIRAATLPEAIRACAPAVAPGAVPDYAPAPWDGNQIVPLAELERLAIAHALKVTKGNVTRAARALGIGRATMYRKLERFKPEPRAATSER